MMSWLATSRLLVGYSYALSRSLSSLFAFLLCQIYSMRSGSVPPSTSRSLVTPLSLPPSLSLFNSLPRSIDHIFVMLSLSLHGLRTLSTSPPLPSFSYCPSLSPWPLLPPPLSLSLSLHSLSYTHAPRERPGVLKGLWQGPVLGQGHQHTWFPLGQSQGPRELPSDGTPGQGEVGWLQEGKDKEFQGEV